MKTNQLRVLMIETAFRRRRSKNPKKDESRWYPPIGLMKFSTYHKMRGDQVDFAVNIDQSLKIPEGGWDRIYISAIFTFHLQVIIKNIDYYNKFVTEGGELIIGGIAPTLMQNEIFEMTGVLPLPGRIFSSAMLGFDDNINIDELSLDYDLIDSNLYAINDTYYGYTSRGCINHCTFCGVPEIEPIFINYVDIKSSIIEMRRRYGDKPNLKLMDNNVLASSRFVDIVNDLIKLGYERGGSRNIDFNQGLDSSFFNEENADLLAKLNIHPIRIAFDHLSEREQYITAVSRVIDRGIKAISNYMLFNFKDSPQDLYERIIVNIELNEGIAKEHGFNHGKISCYPMRYAPIKDQNGGLGHANRDYQRWKKINFSKVDWLNNPVWIPKFTRSIEVIRGSGHGSIPWTAKLARRAIGHNFREFVTNLFAPEKMIRNRNYYEKQIYNKKQVPGTGELEEFREFIICLIKTGGKRFDFFIQAIADNRNKTVQKFISNCDDDELRYWLMLYVK